MIVYFVGKTILQNKCTLRQTASDETIIWTVEKVHQHN